MTPGQRNISTAEAHVAGGRAEGHGHTADGALEVDLRTPTEMGGQGGGTKPEEFFAHRTCPYSNATRGNIGVALTVNGRGVETTSEAVAA